MIFFGLSKTFWGLVVRFVEPGFFKIIYFELTEIMCSRCLVGLLNGNIGVMKSMVAGWYYALCFPHSLILFSWQSLRTLPILHRHFLSCQSCGLLEQLSGTLSFLAVFKISEYLRRPFMGGTLARPHDRWPHIFSNQFWVDYPYFLPCAGSAAFSAGAFVISAIFLKEVSVSHDGCLFLTQRCL